MKKLILSFFALCIFCVTPISAQTDKEKGTGQQSDPQSLNEKDWQRAEQEQWQGADDIWYKRESEAILKSEDGKTWVRTDDNRFQTKDGSWYRYEKGQLKKSSDGLKWEDAMDWSDEDGRSFRFDNQGRLNTQEKVE